MAHLPRHRRRHGQLGVLLFFETPNAQTTALDAIPHRLPCFASGMGRLARPAILRHLRCCTLCDAQALEDERHFVFDCLNLPTFASSLCHCTKMLTVPCMVLCGRSTRRLSDIAEQPFSTWLMTLIKMRPHQLISSAHTLHGPFAPVS